MNLRLSNLRAPLGFDISQLASLVAEALQIPVSAVRFARLQKKSVDARRKQDIHFVLGVDFTLAPGITPPRHPYLIPIPAAPAFVRPTLRVEHRPMVVGFGPAGLMAALTLAEAGLRPIVLERGRDAERRRADVSRFWSDGTLNPASNVQYGEGGAGLFSDGKLSTGIKDSRCGRILRVFYEHGAPEEILYQAKPHIGTDNLPRMVKSIRSRIVAMGGEVLFERKLVGLCVESGALIGAQTEGEGKIFEQETRDLILAVGHSARDTLETLCALGVPMRKKPFSIGVRVEHSQAMIDRAQYGGFAGHPALGAAEYKLSERLPDGRGVYTFCMCPGGQVVAAASHPGQLVVNGMSRFARDGANANSALLVSVEPGDFPGDSPLSGLYFQEKWERLAFQAGSRFRAPAQLMGDFLQGVPSSGPADIQPSYRPGIAWTDVSLCLPDFAARSLRAAIPLLERRLRGFSHPGAVLTGVETRSSSPVTLPRDARCMSALKGLYPAGEGAGYAGGILSAAVDGMRCAEAVLERYTAR